MVWIRLWLIFLLNSFVGIKFLKLWRNLISLVLLIRNWLKVMRVLIWMLHYRICSLLLHLSLKIWVQRLQLNKFRGPFICFQSQLLIDFRLNRIKNIDTCMLRVRLKSCGPILLKRSIFNLIFDLWKQIFVIPFRINVDQLT